MPLLIDSMAASESALFFAERVVRDFVKTLSMFFCKKGKISKSDCSWWCRKIKLKYQQTLLQTFCNSKYLFWMPNKVGWLTDWLTAWLTKWLDGWLTDCTIASLIILFNPFLKDYVALEIHVVICSRELYGHDVWRTCALLDSSSTLLVRDDIASISSPAVSIDSGSRSSKTPSKSSFIWRPRKKTPSIWKKYLLLNF